MSLSTLALFLSSTFAETPVLDGMACMLKCKALYGGCRVRHPEDAAICQKSEMACMGGCSSSTRSEEEELEAATNSLEAGPLKYGPSRLAGKYVGSLDIWPGEDFYQTRVFFDMHFDGLPGSPTATVDVKAWIPQLNGKPLQTVSCLNKHYGYSARGPGDVLWLTEDDCLDKAMEDNDLEVVWTNYDWSTDVVSLQIRISKKKLVTVQLAKAPVLTGTYKATIATGSTFDASITFSSDGSTFDVSAPVIDMDCQKQWFMADSEGNLAIEATFADNDTAKIDPDFCVTSALHNSNTVLDAFGYNLKTDTITAKVLNQKTEIDVVFSKTSQGGSLQAPARFE